MTYRDRRIAKAARLEEWADKREVKAEAILKVTESYTRDHAFNTQPGHMPVRAKIIAREDRAYESLNKASEFRSRASGILAAADRAIYSDDDNAVEALEARIVDLESKREAMKTKNAAFRKEHKDRLKAMTSYERDLAMPHQSFELTNLGGNISRNKKRLEQLKAR